MIIQISTGSNTPIYRQIVEQIRQAVVTGKLHEGDALPSVRSLANQLVINHNTVAKAYSRLVQEGVAISHPGRGLFVAPLRNIYSDEERQRRLDQALDQFLAEVATLGFTKSEIQEALNAKLPELTLLKD